MISKMQIKTERKLVINLYHNKTQGGLENTAVL